MDSPFLQLWDIWLCRFQMCGIIDRIISEYDTDNLITSRRVSCHGKDPIGVGIRIVIGIGIGICVTTRLMQQSGHKVQRISYFENTKLGSKEEEMPRPSVVFCPKSHSSQHRPYHLASAKVSHSRVPNP
jgi:hypothetical protein